MNEMLKRAKRGERLLVLLATILLGALALTGAGTLRVVQGTAVAVERLAPPAVAIPAGQTVAAR